MNIITSLVTNAAVFTAVEFIVITWDIQMLASNEILVIIHRFLQYRSGYCCQTCRRKQGKGVNVQNYFMNI
jgi:hypothetical protein